MNEWRIDEDWTLQYGDEDGFIAYGPEGVVSDDVTPEGWTALMALVIDAKKYQEVMSKCMTQAFYLHAHPEDAKAVALEMLGLQTNERDQYGHILNKT